MAARMPRESSDHRRAEPTAPPVSQMSIGSSDHQHQQHHGQHQQPSRSATNWGPPPPYTEAIAADRPAYLDQCGQAGRATPGAPASGGQGAARVPSSTSQERLARQTVVRANEPPSQSRRSCSRQNGSLTSIDNRPPRSGSARYRSASPGGVSDGGRDGSSQERASIDDGSRENNSNGPKRSSKSKIKKGLENIAFFIIQILD